MNREEVRTFSLETDELRVERGSNRPPVIRGLAAPFNKLSKLINGLFLDKVAPGAFKRAIEEDDIRANVEHDMARLLGRNTSGTLRLTEDRDGLRIEIDPPDTQVGRDAVTLVERGDLSSMSFRFRALKEEWEHGFGKNGEALRTLRDVNLIDVSLVAIPAYDDTEVAVRSYQEFVKTRTSDAMRIRKLRILEL